VSVAKIKYSDTNKSSNLSYKMKSKYKGQGYSLRIILTVKI
jgi:hypothetical protein